MIQQNLSVIHPHNELLISDKNPSESSVSVHRFGRLGGVRHKQIGLFRMLILLNVVKYTSEDIIRVACSFVHFLGNTVFDRTHARYSFL